MEYEILLTTLTYGGDCLGRLPDGRAAFVPFTLPGEIVRARIVEEKRGHVKMELVEVLQASPLRIAPPCPHFTLCGGCHYQHIPYEEQLTAKAGILREQLARIGGLQAVPLQSSVPSARSFNYRNHVQFHLTAEGRLGYQACRSNQVIPIRECRLLEEDLNHIWPQLAIEAIPGLERVSLRLGADGEVMLILESSDPQPIEFYVEELPISAVHLGPGGTLVLAGSESIILEVLERSFQVSAGSFFQVNTGQAEVMVQYLLNNLPISPQATIVDAYCGVGLFSAFLAPKCARLVGIETSPSACQDFSVNLDEYNHVELYEASTEEALSAVEFKPDLLIVDPPRAGLGPAVVKGILRQGAAYLVYISCDPATLARDARQLIEGGYRLTQITPFDLFPQTYHIESISLWVRE